MKYQKAKVGVLLFPKNLFMAGSQGTEGITCTGAVAYISVSGIGYTVDCRSVEANNYQETEW